MKGTGPLRCCLFAALVLGAWVPQAAAAPAPIPPFRVRGKGPAIPPLRGAARTATLPPFRLASGEAVYPGVGARTAPRPAVAEAPAPPAAPSPPQPPPPPTPPPPPQAAAVAGPVGAARGPRRHIPEPVNAGLARDHYALGFLGLGAMGLGAAIGQAGYSNHDAGRYVQAQLGMSVASAVFFAASGVLSRPAWGKGARGPTTVAHKAAMALTATGLATQIILGSVLVARGGGTQAQPDLGLANLVVNYVTLGFAASGALAFAF